MGTIYKNGIEFSGGTIPDASSIKTSDGSNVQDKLDNLENKFPIDTSAVRHGDITLENEISSINTNIDILKAGQFSDDVIAGVGTSNQVSLQTLNNNLTNFFKVKMYNIDTTIQSNSRFIIPIDVIAGYVPISCFYHGGTGENVVYPTCPRNRATDGTHYVALINIYEQSIYTKGNLFVYYIRQIDVG